MVEQHEAATGPSRKQQTPEAIAENSELLGKPQALRHFGWLLADMTAEETIAAAARQEIRRLKEAGLADEEAFGRVLLRLTLEGPGLVPALLCGTGKTTRRSSLHSPRRGSCSPAVVGVAGNLAEPRFGEFHRILILVGWPQR